MRGLRARVHQAAVRPAGQAASGPAPPDPEAAPAREAAGGLGAKVSGGRRAGRRAECVSVSPGRPRAALSLLLSGSLGRRRASQPSSGVGPAVRVAPGLTIG